MKTIKKLIFVIPLILASCQPDHDAYLINRTREKATLYYGNKSKEIPPNSEISYEDLKHDNKLFLEISKRRIMLGEKLKEIDLDYHAHAAAFVGEPHHLLIQISKDGFLYLGYRTVKDRRSGLFERQPESFPLRWN